jgi:diadenosine tetraphosphatase ApaH/serine/threonine PP2A family protein phosphatase
MDTMRRAMASADQVAVITDIHGNLPALEAAPLDTEFLDAPEHGGELFANSGSVGKPKDGDPRAAFAVLRPAGESVEVIIERVRYDAGAVAAEVRRSGLPGEFADKLLLAA